MLMDRDRVKSALIKCDLKLLACFERHLGKEIPYLFIKMLHFSIKGNIRKKMA